MTRKPKIQSDNSEKPRPASNMDAWLMLGRVLQILRAADADRNDSPLSGADVVEHLNDLAPEIRSLRRALRRG